MLAGAPSPGALAEVDIDRARQLLGEEDARSLEALGRLSRQLRESGLVEQKEGRMRLTPRGLRRIGDQALADLYTKLQRYRNGQHPVGTAGSGHERAGETKLYEWGDPFNLSIQQTVRNALARRGPGTPVQLSPEDFEIERTEALTRSATVIMLDLSLSMPMRGNFVAAKKMTMALHSLISGRFPSDYLGIVGFLAFGSRGKFPRPARSVLGLRLGHQHPARPGAGPPAPLSPAGHQTGNNGDGRRAHGALARGRAASPCSLTRPRRKPSTPHW